MTEKLDRIVVVTARVAANNKYQPQFSSEEERAQYERRLASVKGNPVIQRAIKTHEDLDRVTNGSFSDAVDFLSEGVSISAFLKNTNPEARAALRDILMNENQSGQKYELISQSRPVTRDTKIYERSGRELLYVEKKPVTVQAQGSSTATQTSAELIMFTISGNMGGAE